MAFFFPTNPDYKGEAIDPAHLRNGFHSSRPHAHHGHSHGPVGPPRPPPGPLPAALTIQRDQQQGAKHEEDASESGGESKDDDEHYSEHDGRNSPIPPDVGSDVESEYGENFDAEILTQAQAEVEAAERKPKESEGFSVSSGPAASPQADFRPPKPNFTKAALYYNSFAAPKRTQQDSYSSSSSASPAAALSSSTAAAATLIPKVYSDVIQSAVKAVHLPPAAGAAVLTAVTGCEPHKHLIHHSVMHSSSVGANSPNNHQDLEPESDATPSGSGYSSPLHRRSPVLHDSDWYGDSYHRAPITTEPHAPHLDVLDDDDDEQAAPVLEYSTADANVVTAASFSGRKTISTALNGNSAKAAVV